MAKCVFDCVYMCMSVCIFLKLPVHDRSLEKMRKCRNKEPFQTFPGMFESNEPLGTAASWQDKAGQVEGWRKTPPRLVITLGWSQFL